MTTDSDRAAERDEGRRGVMRDALKTHFAALWKRAQTEREPREQKWLRNILTGDGEGPGLTGDHARVGADGAWRSGDRRKAGKERLRVARQKLTTAKSSLGDSVYKSNKVPFLLNWRQAMAGGQVGEEQLAAIKARVDEIMAESGAAMTMRDALEDGATWGEYWLHGLVGNDREGRMQGTVEVPSPWEMYVDLGSEDQPELAEYVIRRRRLTRFEVWRLVGADQQIFDAGAVARALEGGARKGASGDGRDHPKEQASGRAYTDTVEWREVWAFVPNKLMAEDGAAEDTGGGDGADPGAMVYVPVMAVFADDEPVALVENPGPRPYARFIWDRDRTSPHPQGIYDAMEDTQECITGVIRAWLSNLRESSTLTLAGHRDQLRQDPEAMQDGVRWLDLDPDTRDVREAIQQFKVDALTSGLVEAVEMLLTFADLESNIPRILQGQQPQADQTAFEIRNRLMAAGKYLGEVVRRHDPAIIWLVGWVLHVMALAGEIEHETIVQIRAMGFATYSDLVQKVDGLIRLLDLGARNEQVGARLRPDWIARQVAQAEEIDTAQAFISDEEYQAAQQAQAQSEERQLALAEAQARMEGLRAKAARDTAAADEARARGQLGRAKFIKDVEDDARGGQAGAVLAGAGAGREQRPEAAGGQA